MPVVTGTFKVSMTPLEQQGEQDVKLGRMALKKEYDGDLVGSSNGSMLTAMTPVQGSADYVAIEQFIGRLSDKHGSFVLTHHGRMHGEISELRISVVPDSATVDLVGLRGTMEIDKKDGEHHFSLTYNYV